LGQGRAAAVKFLEDNPEMAAKLEKEIRQRVFGNASKKDK
jgi:hypothetical protein